MSREATPETAIEVPYSVVGSTTRMPADEVANSITHGIGLLASVAGAVLLMTAAKGSSINVQAACAIYMGSMIAVYAASTLSHVVQTPRVKHRLRCWDQGLIYLLIAGTYTPFTVQWMNHEWVRPFFLAMWGLALVGFVSKIIFAHRVDAISLPLYLLIAWVPTMLFLPAVETIPSAALSWTVAGGIAYTIGTVFLVLDHKAWFVHSIWHLLVMIGSATQFVAIRYYVVG